MKALDSLTRFYRDNLRQIKNQQFSNPRSGFVGMIPGGTLEAGGSNLPVFSLTTSMAAFPPAKRVMDLIGNLYASIPKRVIGPEPKREWIQGSRLNQFLENPSSLTDGATFWQWMGAHWVATGNAVAVIQRDRSGFPAELYPAALAGVRTDVTLQGTRQTIYNASILSSNSSSIPNISGYPFAEVQGGMFEYDPIDILHFRGPNFDYATGVSLNPVMQSGLRLTFLMWQAVRIYLERVMAGGVIAPFGIEVNEELTDEEEQRLKTMLQSMHSGVSQAGNTIILGEGEKLVPLNVQAIQTELVKLQDRLTYEICQYSGVPPILIYAMGERTPNSGQRPALSAQWSQFIRSSVSGQFIKDAAECSRKLLSFDAYVRQGRRVEFDSRRLELGSFEEALRVIGQAVQKDGILTPNLGLYLLGLPPVPGGDELRTGLTGATAPGQQEALPAPNGAPTPPTSEEAEEAVNRLLQ